jgi:hypothetical protein
MLSLLLLPACIHGLTMHSMDGETLSGKYRFAREGKGLIKVIRSDGEVLTGHFVTIGPKAFVESFKKAFGSGSIVVYGPDASAYGNAFGGTFASAHGTAGAAYGETFNTGSGQSTTVVTGPRFYWTAFLQGSGGTTMACFFIGSSYTGHGFGRCKSNMGKEYSVEF